MNLKSLLNNYRIAFFSVILLVVVIVVSINSSSANASLAMPEFDSVVGKSGVTENSKFDKPMATTVSPDGSKLYVLDTGNNQIQIFKTSDNSYIGKFGTSGSGNGQFANPSDLAFNNDGSKLYVADTGNSRVQIFNGTNNSYIGQFGERSCKSEETITDGNFCFPTAITVDKDNNILVGDNSNYRVQKFSSSNMFILKFGEKGNTSSVTPPGTFYDIKGIASDSNNNIYVVNSTNHHVAKYDTFGTFLQEVGSWGSGVNQLRYPTDIEIDSNDNLYIMDVRPGRNNSTVKRFNVTGVGQPPSIGQYGTGDGQFKDPQGIAVSPDGSKLYVADTYNNRIQIFNTNDNSFQGKFGSSSQQSGGFLNPYQTALSKDNTKLYVADSANHRIQIFNTSDNSYVGEFGSLGSATGQFSTPYALTVSPDGTKLYVADSANHRIQIFNTSDNSFVSSLGVTGSGNGQFSNPYGVTFSEDGSKFYVVDLSNNRIQIFNTSDNSYVGKFGSAGAGDGQLSTPRAILISGGKIFVSDTGNNRVQVFDAADNTYLGQFGGIGSANGQLSNPRGLATSPDGSTIYVTERDNNRIQAFNTSDYSYAGKFGRLGSKNGEFNVPVSITINNDGSKLYVTDQANNRIQVFSYANVDTDGDGIVSGVEDAAPNAGDGNDDGIKDSTQSNVTSFVNTQTNKYVTLVSPAGTTITSTSVAAAIVEDAGKDYPFGLLSFTVEGVTPGDTIEMEVFFFTDVVKDGFIARKFNSSTELYSDLLGSEISESLVNGNPSLALNYQIEDGGESDEDGVTNGTIVDPVGLALNRQATGSNPASANNVTNATNSAGKLAKTGQSEIQIMLLAATLFSVGVGVLYRIRERNTY
jgi:tripartite motif-containing protein 71